jgi:hypothetical protein
MGAVMSVIDSPFVVFATVLLLQWLAAYVGDVLRRKMRAFRKEGERQDFDIIRTASLTLWALSLASPSRWRGAVSRIAKAQQTPIMALVVSGANEVFNAQGYTQAAWWNRIPFTAWMLMGLIAIACNLLMGYGEHRTTTFLFVLPLIISTSMFLVADIDSPRSGIIRVEPHNLLAQCQSMRAT